MVGAGWVAEEALGGFGVEGWSEEIALGEVAAEGAEVIELGRLLDPLGHDSGVAFAGNGEHQFHDVAAGTIGLHIGDEGAVDFEDVGRDVVEGGKGERGSAEAVDRSDDVEALELSEQGGGQVGMGHGDGFGDAELQGGRPKVGITEAGFNSVKKMRASEVAGREVDGEVQGSAGGFEAGKMARGFANDPLIDEGHQAGVFGGVDEFVRGNETLGGMLPTKQSFETDDLLGIDLENGLKEDAKLIAVEGGAKIGFELEARDGALMHGGVEEFGAVSAHGLGAAKRGFGVVEEIVGALLFRGVQGAADADVRAEFSLLEDQRCGDGGVKALGDAKDIAGLGAGIEEDGELVATEAGEDDGGIVAGTGNGVGGAQRGLEAKSDFDEDSVAGDGSHRVVEGLEAVEINEQESVVEIVVAAGLGGGALETIKEEAAVGESGEGVMESVVGELGLSGDTLGNVAVDDNEFLDFAARIADGAGVGFKDAPLAVFVPQAVLQAFANTRGAGLAGGVEDFEAVVGMNLLKDRSVGEFGGGVAEDALIGWAVVEAMAFGVDQGDHVGSVLGDDAEQFVAIGGTAVGKVDPEELGSNDEDEGGGEHGCAKRYIGGLGSFLSGCREEVLSAQAILVSGNCRQARLGAAAFLGNISPMRRISAPIAFNFSSMCS